MINLLSETAYVLQTNKIKTAITNKVNEIKDSLARIGTKLGATINWLDDVESTLYDELTAINTELTDKGSTQADDFSEVAEKISNIETGITPTGQIAITQNGTYDVTNYASASVAVPEIKTATVAKTLTAEATSISFENPLGVAPKAFILTNANDGQTMQSGEIRRVTFFLINGSSYTNNRVNGQSQTVLATTNGDNVSTMKISVGDTITLGHRSNTYYLPNIEYSLKMYFWDEVEE